MEWIVLKYSAQTSNLIRVSKTDAMELAFEAALKNLETVIEELESGNVPLEKLVEKYEEGTSLLKVCHKRLNQAELKIEKLREKAGQPGFENFDPGP